MAKFSVLVTFEGGNDVDAATYVDVAVSCWNGGMDPESAEATIHNVKATLLRDMNLHRALCVWLVNASIKGGIENRSLRFITAVAAHQLDRPVLQRNIKQALVAMNLTLKEITNG